MAHKTHPDKMDLPDKPAFARTANPQTESLFFSRLPGEIRQMIYVEMWRTAGSLGQHIMAGSEDGRLRHAVCITDPRREDIRPFRFQAAVAGEDKDVWERRCKSDWCLHWACQEAYEAGKKTEDGAGVASPFLSVLLTSKRIYLEAQPTIFSAVTFIFTDVLVATAFITHPPAALHRLELCMSASPALAELYFPRTKQEGPFPTRPRRAYITAQNNDWQRLCARLATMPALHALRVWFDCKDLRPWHKRFAETPFFRGLWDVRAREFALALPKLPVRRELEADMFLEGETLERAPFVVERGPRPNNWLVHLSSMDTMLRGRQYLLNEDVS